MYSQVVTSRLLVFLFNYGSLNQVFLADCIQAKWSEERFSPNELVVTIGAYNFTESNAKGVGFTFPQSMPFT